MAIDCSLALLSGVYTAVTCCPCCVTLPFSLFALTSLLHVPSKSPTTSLIPTTYVYCKSIDTTILQLIS